MTPKQQKFIDEYLVDLNATQAAIRAGYSVKTAQEQGSQNLSKLMVPIAHIAELDSYSWDEKKDNTPQDSNDHMINSVQYAFIPYMDKIGGIPVEIGG